MKTFNSCSLQLTLLLWIGLICSDCYSNAFIPARTYTASAPLRHVMNPFDTTERSKYHENSARFDLRKRRDSRFALQVMQFPGDDEDGSLTSRKGNPFLYLTVLNPLLLVYISNQWSRSSVYYLVNFADGAVANTAMNVDLGFSEAQYGALASVAFTALFAIASLFAGNLADKFDRKAMTVAACCIWSAATLGTGFAQDYDQVLAARVVMGLGAAFTTPAAYTLIKDLFPEERAGFAASLYGSGVYFGGALASLTILLDNYLGWRDTTLAIGGVGFAAAALSAFLLPSDPAQDMRNREKIMSAEMDIPMREEPSFLSSASEVLSSPSIRLLYLASFFRFCAGLTIGVWGATFFKETYPNDAQSYAVLNAFIVGICGAVSGVVGGALSDFLSTKSEKWGRLSVPIIGSFLASIAWFLCINADNFQAAMIFLGVEYLLAENWFGPTIAALQGSTSRGGTAQGIFTLTGALGNAAPTLLGAYYGSINTGGTESSEELGMLLSASVCIGYVLSAFAFALSADAMSSERRFSN